MITALAHQELEKNGFAKLGMLLDLDQVAALKQESERLLARQSRSWSKYREYAKEGRWSGVLFADKGSISTYVDVIGQSPVIDGLLEQLLGREDLRALLQQVLGAHYRIWYASIRRDEVGAPSLRMHRDQPGEVGLSILVDDTPTIAGTTVFIRGSHRWPGIINLLRWVYPNHIRRFLAGTVGIAGEGYLFYNSTWHGRMKTDSIPRTALILTFLPESESVHRRPSQEAIASLGPNLKALLSAQPSAAE